MNKKSPIHDEVFGMCIQFTLLKLVCVFELALTTTTNKKESEKEAHMGTNFR